MMRPKNRQVPLKCCRSCNEKVPVARKQCPSCGFVFYASKRHAGASSDKRPVSYSRRQRPIRSPEFRFEGSLSSELVERRTRVAARFDRQPLPNRAEQPAQHKNSGKTRFWLNLPKTEDERRVVCGQERRFYECLPPDVRESFVAILRDMNRKLLSRF